MPRWLQINGTSVDVGEGVISFNVVSNVGVKDRDASLSDHGRRRNTLARIRVARVFVRLEGKPDSVARDSLRLKLPIDEMRDLNPISCYLFAEFAPRAV